MKQKICSFYCYRNNETKSSHSRNKMDKLGAVVFDMDGVLTDIISSWKHVHDHFKTSNERSVDDYLKGKIDDMEFIRKDASLWIENGKPIKKEKLVKILSDVPLTKGAKLCIDTLKKNKIKTAIVSAGLNILAQRVARELGIDYVYSNGVKTDEQGYLTGVGVLEVKLMHKDETVKKIAKELNIPLKRIAAVGNSCFDISMFEVSGLSIAFNPGDECTKDAADVVVNGNDLSRILPHLEKYIF